MHTQADRYKQSVSALLVDVSRNRPVAAQQTPITQEAATP
jgi:hypothetical protein